MKWQLIMIGSSIGAPNAKTVENCSLEGGVVQYVNKLASLAPHLAKRTSGSACVTNPPQQIRKSMLVLNTLNVISAKACASIWFRYQEICMVTEKCGLRCRDSSLLQGYIINRHLEDRHGY